MYPHRIDLARQIGNDTRTPRPWRQFICSRQKMEYYENIPPSGRRASPCGCLPVGQGHVGGVQIQIRDDGTLYQPVHSPPPPRARCHYYFLIQILIFLILINYLHGSLSRLVVTWLLAAVRSGGPLASLLASVFLVVNVTLSNVDFARL